MQTQTIDKTGKLYIPKEMREKMKSKTVYLLRMPNGDIVIHETAQSKNPADALKNFQKLGGWKGTVKQLKKEVLETALGYVG